jgi:hypothetical protein
MKDGKKGRKKARKARLYKSRAKKSAESKALYGENEGAR